MVEYGLVSLVGWPMGWPLGSPPCCVSLSGDCGVRSGEPGGLTFGWLAGLLRIENTGPVFWALPPLRRWVAYHFSGTVEYGLVSQVGRFGVPTGCSNVAVGAIYWSDHSCIAGVGVLPSAVKFWPDGGTVP